MFNILRGDTFLKAFKPTKEYTFQIGDKIHVAVLLDKCSKNYLYENVIIFDKETKDVDILIPPEATSKFELGNLLLEIEVTYGDGIVKTQQYTLNVEGDGIYERN